MSLSVNQGDALEQAKARQEAAKQAKETAEKAKAGKRSRSRCCGRERGCRS